MRFTLPIIALAAIAVPASAMASAGEQTVTIRINFADVDVNTAEGRAILEQRIDAQIERACTAKNTSRYAMGRTTRDESCIADARAEALAEVERFAASERRQDREVAAN